MDGLVVRGRQPWDPLMLPGSQGRQGRQPWDPLMLPGSPWSSGSTDAWDPQMLHGSQASRGMPGMSTSDIWLFLDVPAGRDSSDKRVG